LFAIWMTPLLQILANLRISQAGSWSASAAAKDGELGSPQRMARPQQNSRFVRLGELNEVSRYFFHRLVNGKLNFVGVTGLMISSMTMSDTAERTI
jgi:hypothetical protein